MKPTKTDKRKDFYLDLLIPIVSLWMFFDTKCKYIYDKSFDYKREEPYVLLANHTFMFDVIHVPLKLKVHPFIVASQNLFSKQPLKFLLAKVAHAIPKSKGASDIRTAKELIGAVRRQYPILIFPEGNTTFNGETNYIEESTMKLIKKLKIDVVACNVKGGYLSKPRWATGKRKNRRAKLHFKVILKGEDIKDISLEEISKTVNEGLYSNDYEYQRKEMIPHPGKKLAEGIENILYICPECESIGAIEAHKSTIKCNSCGNEGFINKYGFIEGFKFDNTVDWDKWQRKFDKNLINEVIESPGKIYLVNDVDFNRKFLGNITIRYEDKKFIITGGTEMVFPFDEIKNPIVTLRREFNINFEGEHYLILIEKYITSFLRVVQEKY
jgi:1-acyl-sn-glycerol-3-phosphate acyltransferase